jgi:heme exporter protein C
VTWAVPPTVITPVCIRLIGPSLIDPRMLWPLLTMAVATKFWFAASLLSRARVDLIELEGGKDWVKQLTEGAAA